MRPLEKILILTNIGTLMLVGVLCIGLQRRPSVTHIKSADCSAQASYEEGMLFGTGWAMYVVSTSPIAKAFWKQQADNYSRFGYRLREDRLQTPGGLSNEDFNEGLPKLDQRDRDAIETQKIEAQQEALKRQGY